MKIVFFFSGYSDFFHISDKGTLWKFGIERKVGRAFNEVTKIWDKIQTKPKFFTFSQKNLDVRIFSHINIKKK